MTNEIKEIIELIKAKYKDYYIEDFLSGEDVKKLVDYTTNLQEKNKRLINILDEIKNMCKEDYYERNTTDIDSIGLSNNICVMIYIKIKELIGDSDE